MATLGPQPHDAPLVVGDAEKKEALDGLVPPTYTRSVSAVSDDSFKSTASQLPTETTTQEQPPITSELKTHGPTSTVLTGLDASSKAPGPPAVNAAQEAMYAQVLAAVSNWTSVPESTARGAKQVLLTEDERMWLTRECLLRYLRATKWKVPDAIKRLQSTLSWRREYGADTFTADYISPENETGKQVIMGWDFDGRPCLYLNPGNQNTPMSDRQMHHLCYMLDRTIDMQPAGQETNCLIINFAKAKNGSIPSVAQARAALNILQNHNPERLGRALISSLPWYVTTFFKLISPFIDPVTREKMRFSPNVPEFVPMGQLIKSTAGGDLEFEYEHNLYWPSLTEETQRRREACKQKWIAGGKRIGEYEEYLRGGPQKSLSQELQDGAKELETATADLKVSD